MKKTIYFWVFLVLGLIYSYRIQFIGPYDFDSVKNLQIASELASGNFNRLFSHAAPLLHTLNGLIYFIFPNYLALEIVGCIFVILSIIFLSRIFQKLFHLKLLEEWAFIFLAGTCTLFTNASIYISLEPLSLLLFSLIVGTVIFKKSIKTTSLLYGLLLITNYKAILLFPFLVGYLFLHKERGFFINLVYMTIPALSVILIGILVGLPYYLFPKTLYAVAIIKNVNPLISSSSFNMDLFYYIYYLIQFENPLCLFVLLLFPWIFRKKLSYSITNPYLISYLFVISTFIIMSFLQKAPRGLLWIYPFLYLYIILIINTLTKSLYLKLSIYLVCFSYQLYLIKTNILDYRYSNYETMGKEILRREITTIESTIGINTIPFLVNKVNLTPVFQLSEVSQKIYLLDYYYQVAGFKHFETPSNAEIVYALPEKSLEAPFLWLENCEYAGIGFKEALRNREILKKFPNRLFLVKIP